MRDRTVRIGAALICAGLVLASCRGGWGPRVQCRVGVCVDIELVEPIGFDVPVEAVLIVTTDRDISGLQVAIASLQPLLLVEGGVVREDFPYWTWKTWQVDAKAGEPIRRTTLVRFTHEGWYWVDGYAWAFDTDFIHDAVPVQVTLEGGTPYPPTPEGGWEPIETLEEPPETPTPEVEGQGFQIEPQSDWVLVHEQTFEGAFPASGWTVRDASADGYDRTWDDDNYRAHGGAWAAWPANGGKDAIKPAPGNDNYPNNLDARMIYGPFDLSDAVEAAVTFWLWWEIEPKYDYLTVEISRDGVAFQELARYSGLVRDWYYIDLRFDGYARDASVWLAWRFVSDTSVTFDGPWVDDIRISEKRVGTVQASGSFFFFDRLSQETPARFTTVELYDAESGRPDTLLAMTVSDANGAWSFGPIANLDPDDGGTLDLYVHFVLEVVDSAAARRKVAYYNGVAYRWASPTRANVVDGAMNFGKLTIGTGSQQAPAMWIFQDLRQAWEYVVASAGADPGPASVQWHWADTPPLMPDASFFWPYPPLQGIQILLNDARDQDTVLHELGHQYMYNQVGWWFYPVGNLDEMLGCLSHEAFSRETPLCAWTEGWGYFFSMAVRGSSRSGPDDFEKQSPGDGRPEGDAVEGRVLGALWDLFDNANDGLDQGASFGFAPIWNLLRSDPDEDSLSLFWLSWRWAGHNQHRAVKAIYQNTIDYDLFPVLSELPDLTLLEGTRWPHALDLWDYASDLESTDAELSFRIAGFSDWHCWPSLDSHFLDLASQPGWTGQCTVNVSVSDDIKTYGRSFLLRVAPVVGRVYLPLILRDR